MSLTEDNTNAASLTPPVFEGVNYKRWRARTVIWLTTMRCFDASKDKPQRELTPVEEKAFEEADNLMRGAIISVIGDNIVDSYMSITMGKEMWDALESKFRSRAQTVNCMSWSNSLTTR
jgi:hypothetical protein